MYTCCLTTFTTHVSLGKRNTTQYIKSNHSKVEITTAHYESLLIFVDGVISRTIKQQNRGFWGPFLNNITLKLKLRCSYQHHRYGNLLCHEDDNNI